MANLIQLLSEEKKRFYTSEIKRLTAENKKGGTSPKKIASNNTRIAVCNQLLNQ